LVKQVEPPLSDDVVDEDSVDFFYLLDKHGWSTCYIHVNHELYCMEPTHIFGNPISILLENFTALLNGATEIAFVWHDEPGTYSWSIARIAAQQHKLCINIDGCMQLVSSKRTSLTFTVKIKQFCISLLRQTQKIRDMMQENSYREHRGEFPQKEFAEFERAYAKAFGKSLNTK
jgi:hypothetical protein